MRDNKPKTVALVTLVVAVIGLTVAFASLSSKLNISGSAKLDPINWDIYFDNIANINKEGKASIERNPVIDTNDKRKIKDIEVILKEPGDKVSFTVDLVNESDITAYIKSAEVGIKTIPEGVKHDFIEFKAIYTGTNIEVRDGNVIAARTAAGEERKNITISIYYSKEKVTNDDLNNIPPEGLNISFNYELIFEQSNKLANMPTTTEKWINGCTEVTKKDTYEVGDVISFCNENKSYRNSDGVLVKGKSEDFYVIKDNGNTVTALAKYSLLVGSSTNLETGDTTTISTDTENYGLQSDKTVFYTVEIIGESEKYSSNIFNGHIQFSEVSYWEDENGNLLPRYGTSYPAEVYDELSPLYPFVNNYKNYISETLGKKSISTRLITNNELVNLGCVIDNQKEYTGNCSKAPSWVYSTSYSSSTVSDDTNLYLVGGKEVYGIFDMTSSTGIRPVITINKSGI